MQCFGISDPGRVRENNEDSFYAGKIEDYTVMIVADGMGGHSGGEIASRKAVDITLDYIAHRIKKTVSPTRMFEILRGALGRANMDILKAAAGDRELSGMGTTIDVCVVDNLTAYIAHVGDSRVYRITSASKTMQITRDHTLVEYMIATGEITHEEALIHPQRHMITRALGTDVNVDADTYVSAVEKGDTILLCSDGLTNMLADDEIASIINNSESAEKAATALVDKANEMGGTDNITVVVARK